MDAKIGRARLFLGLTISMVAGLGGKPAAADVDVPLGCGGQSLYILLRLYHYDVRVLQIERSLPAGTMCSMQDIQQAANLVGLKLRGMKISARKLPLDRPVIALLHLPTEGHFIVLRPVGTMGTMVQILDPPHPPIVVDYQWLLASPAWTGMVLVPVSPSEDAVILVGIMASLLVFALSFARIRRAAISVVHRGLKRVDGSWHRPSRGETT